jgi:methionyl-tRNA formyltransferase
MRQEPSAVKRAAIDRGLHVYQPEKLSAESVERIRSVRPEALVVAAYGLLLPQALLDVAPLGAWNIHASLLPRWRGAAPIQRALLAGDPDTGVSIMKMDAGLDTGPVLARRALPISEEDDSRTLHDRLAALGAEMMVAALAEIGSGRAQPQPQPATGATYAPKIDKQETVLDWRRTAVELERAIRAFRPAPGASTLIGGQGAKIWRARCVNQRGVAGHVLRTGSELIVACGEGALQILELQRAGGKRLAADQFLRGHALQPGDRLG